MVGKNIELKVRCKWLLQMETGNPRS